MNSRTKIQNHTFVCQLETAFSLIELMVVVAVIAILIGLLIPSVRAVREKAWDTQCRNNLRQYGIMLGKYMADWNGDFVYAGAGGASAGGGFTDDTNIDKERYFRGVYGRGGEGLTGSRAHSWQDMIASYLPQDVTIQSLSKGQSSVRVCPYVLHELQYGNYFDPDSPDFKGDREETNSLGEAYVYADFENRSGKGFDDNDKIILDSYFTTYAINQRQTRKNKKDIPENVIAFIDWNAKEGWDATITYTNWMFKSLDDAIEQDTPKWTNAWWLTEVGFHHRRGQEYGANYLAMDGHVGWISSNEITITNFTGQ